MENQCQVSQILQRNGTLPNYEPKGHTHTQKGHLSKSGNYTGNIQYCKMKHSCYNMLEPCAKNMWVDTIQKMQNGTAQAMDCHGSPGSGCLTTWRTPENRGSLICSQEKSSPPAMQHNDAQRCTTFDLARKTHRQNDRSRTGQSHNRDKSITERGCTCQFMPSQLHSGHPSKSLGFHNAV